MPPMKRFMVAGILNLLVPGTGLILLGRTWLGIALAVWFALGAQVGAFGLLIAPASVPFWISGTALALAALSWLVAQAQLTSRIRFLRDPNLPEEMDALRRLAETAISRGDLAAARSALRVALAVDDADLRIRILWARLLSLDGRTTKARRAWRLAQRLDREHAFATEIRSELQRLETA